MQTISGNNRTIKSRLKEMNIPQWKVARHLGINEFSFSRMMRDELDTEHRELVMRAIDELSAHNDLNKR